MVGMHCPGEAFDGASTGDGGVKCQAEALEIFDSFRPSEGQVNPGAWQKEDGKV